MDDYEVGIIDDTSRHYINDPLIVDRTYLLDNETEIFGNQVCNLNRNNTNYTDQDNFVCDKDFHYTAFNSNLVN